MKRASILSTLAFLSISTFPLFAFSEEPVAPANEVKAEAKETKIEDVAGYDKGFFVQTTDGKFRLLVTGYIQEQLSGLFRESAADEYTVRLRRARLKFSGHLYSKDVQYELEYDFSTNRLLNAFGQFAHCEGMKFRLGQYYVPFDFENQASSSGLQFVERSIANAYFGIPDQREPGIGINGAVMDKKLEYDVGAFNGEGINNNNANKSFRYAGRLAYNIAGHHGYEYSDIKRSEEAQVVAGAAFMYNDTPDAATIPVGSTVATFEKADTSVTADIAAKYKGLGAMGAFLFRKSNPETGSPTNAGTTTDDTGWLVQAGYMLVGEKLEAAARIAQVYVDGGNDLGEYTAGLNYYIHGGHRVKLQLNYSMLTTENGIAAGDDRMDHRVVAQLQMKI